MNNLIIQICTGFGLGKSKFFPGTVGSLLGIPISLLLINLQWYFQLPLITIFILIAIFICDRGEKLFGYKDPSCIVIDEYITIPITIIGISNIWAILTGFIFHRIFDIIKPYPINKLEKFSGGLGIVLDDVVAGILALFINYILLYFEII